MSVATLEAAIHAWWSDGDRPRAVALNALLDASRFVSGTWQHDDGTDNSTPYCTLNREGSTQAWQTNCGWAGNGLVRFQLWHTDHAAGLAIRQAIFNCFHNADYEIDDITIESMRHQTDLAIQEDDGVWQFLIDFSVIHKVRVA